MMNKKEKMVKIAHDVFWGKGDTDHPSCPECGSTMNFLEGMMSLLGMRYGNVRIASFSLVKMI